MREQITYSVLKYIHSPGLGESLNVGVALYYHSSDRYDFKYSLDLQRFNHLYEGFRITFLKSYLDNIRIKALNLNHRQDKFPLPNESEKRDFLGVLHEKVLGEDETVLQFSEPLLANIGGLNSLRSFIENIVPFYTEEKSLLIKHDDKFLANKFKREVKKGGELVTRKITPDYVLTINELTYRFDYAWQNGTRNLVKGLSFNLSEKQSISNKAFLTSGYLNTILNSEFKKDEYRFDFLVSKPKDKKLYKTYDSAVKAIEDISVNKVIVPENEIVEYSATTIKELSK